ncbi:MAG TPA: hypothetical protein VFV38_11480 [Ktedonobacteraceae bacterium]|nr:hypothetical protein [Ktedonobacteraceae bacterium]
MEDRTLLDVPGIELDAEMAQRILDHGNRYSQQTAELAIFIRRYQASFRTYLLSQDLIHTSLPSTEGFDLAAVDGSSAHEPHGGGTLVAATAYKSSVNNEVQRGAAEVILLPNDTELESFLTLLRMHLELSLLAPDKLDADFLVILDHSFWGVMQGVSRALATYKSQRQRLLQANLDPDVDVTHQAWKKLFQECLGLNGSFLRMIRNKQVISLSKKGVSQYIVQLLTGTLLLSDSQAQMFASVLNDRALLRHILLPGEYLTPRSLFRTEQAESSIRTWNRSRFATGFDEAMGDGPDPFEARAPVFDEYGLPRDDDVELEGRRLYVTYYRPTQRSRVYRIEFHEQMLANKNGPPNVFGQGERFQRMLAAVRQSLSPDTMEPLCQVLADIRAKNAVSSAISLLPERTFYQLRQLYRDDLEMLDIVDTLTAEERT